MALLGRLYPLPRLLDDIVCYEAGSTSSPAWIGSRAVLELDWAELESAATRRLIELEVQGGEVSIRGLYRVGLMILPSGRRLQIRSKLSSVAILQWLAYLGEFPDLTQWPRDAGIVADIDIHKCIGRLFVAAMEAVTQHHLRRDYVRIRVSEAAITGRILAVALASQLNRLPRVPQVQRKRSLDTPYNRVLAAALDRLPILLVDDNRQNLQRLAHLREQWGQMRRGVDDPVAAVTAAQWASPPGYHVALQLARLILIGAAPDQHLGTGGQAFTLSLANVWERSLRRMFEHVARTNRWRPVPRAKRTRRWDDPAGHEDRRRWMTADAIVERQGVRWVLDAKYKNEFGDEGRTDRFQMCAYALAFDADRVSLVYPSSSVDGADVRGLLSTEVGGKQIRIDSFALPMSQGPEACTASLTKIATLA